MLSDSRIIEAACAYGTRARVRRNHSLRSYLAVRARNEGWGIQITSYLADRAEQAARPLLAEFAAKNKASDLARAAAKEAAKMAAAQRDKAARAAGYLNHQQKISDERHIYHTARLEAARENASEWLARPCREVKARRRVRLMLAETYVYHPENQADKLVNAISALQAEVLAYHLAGNGGWKKRGWLRTSRSGNGSCYLALDGVRLRISGHALPDTDERRHYHGQGLRSYTRQVIFQGTETWSEALAILAEAIN